MNTKVHLSDANFSKRINKELNKMLVIFMQKYKIKRQHAIQVSEFLKLVDNRLVTMQYEFLVYLCCQCLIQYNNQNLFSKYLDLLDRQQILKDMSIYLQGEEKLLMNNLEQAMQFADRALEINPNKLEFVELVLKIFDRKEELEMNFSKSEKKKYIYYLSLLSKLSDNSFCRYMQAKNALNTQKKEKFIEIYLQQAEENYIEPLIDVNLLNVKQFQNKILNKFVLNSQCENYVSHFLTKQFQPFLNIAEIKKRFSESIRYLKTLLTGSNFNFKLKIVKKHN